MAVVARNAGPAELAAVARKMANTVGGRGAERMGLLRAYSGAGALAAVQAKFPAGALAQVEPCVQRVARKLIDSRYIVYKATPQRTGDERYLKLLGAEALDRDMLHLERLTGLLGTMGLLRSYDAERGVLRSAPLLDFEPLFADEETEPFGVIYPVLSNGNAKGREQQYVCWTPEIHMLANGAGEARGVSPDDSATARNPLGIVPVVYAHVCPRLEGWWRPTAEDMVNAQDAFNVFGTHHAIGVLFQSLGQPVASGIESTGRTATGEPEMKIGPWRVIGLSIDGRFEFATPGTDLKQIIESQRAVVDHAASMHHLIVKWAGGSQATSGEHLRIMEIDLTEAVLSDIARWRVFEAERFAVDRALLAAYRITIPDEYSVDFAEPHIPLSPEQERAQWEWEWEHGLSTKRDWLRKYNPDATDAELDAELDAAAAERRRLRVGQGGGLLEALNAG